VISAVKAANVVATRGAVARIETLWDDTKVEAEVA
jgi:hypothetical protein